MKNEKSMKLIDKYRDEFEEDCKIDRMILVERLEDFASVAHKWTYRWFQERTTLNDLEDTREELFAKLAADLEHSNDPRFHGLSATAMSKKIEKTDVIKKIDRRIKDQERLIEYLHNIVDACKFGMPKAWNNIVTIMEIEERGI